MLHGEAASRAPQHTPENTGRPAWCFSEVPVVPAPWPAQKFLCSSATAPMNPDVLDKRRGWPPFFLLVACHFSRMPFTAAWYEEHGDGEPLQLVVEHGGAPQG
uniref:Uncharacterized protein n=1 Tax=Aegilops tauschii subsp. strangulata TaxID=200361 RepID=A0A453KVJ1_AEGTS